MNSYELSRNFCDWSFENPDKIKPIHYAIYFFAIEHCNRLGWKQKFGFPSQMVMEAIGIKNWRTYIEAFNELIEFGFIEIYEKSKNQYSSNIIAIVKNTKADTKALSKALKKHSTKQGQSIDSINKQETKNNKTIPTLDEFMNYALEIMSDVNQEDVRLKYFAWKENNWYTLDAKSRQIKNWKSTLTSSLKYMRKDEGKTPYIPLIIHD